VNLSFKFHAPSNIYPIGSMAPGDPDRHDTFRRIQRSINQIITFMDNVVSLITKITDTWTIFRAADTRHFSHLDETPGQSGSPYMLLHKIDSHITNLGVMCRNVESQRKRLKTLEEQARSLRLGFWFNGDGDTDC